MRAPQSPFSMFGLPVRQRLDPEDLSQRYAKLRTTVHPDKFVNTDPAQRRLAEQMAADLNEAYQTLADPLKRARLILASRGSDPFAETAGTQAPLDPEFLERQMELREQLDDMREGKDKQAAQDFAARLQRMIDGDMERLGALIDERPERLADAVLIAQSLRYLVNCQLEVAVFAAS